VALEGLKRQRARVCACQYRSFDPAIGVPNAGVFVCMFACMIDACVYMCMCTRVVCMSLPLFWILTSVFGRHLFMYARRGGGLGSSTIFKKFHETYAPS